MSGGSPWAALLPVAMIGTDRHAGALPSWPGDVGALVAEAATGEPASAVLRTAAVVAVCHLAGAQGAPWSAPRPDAAPDDTLPPLPAGPLLAAAGWLFDEGPARLQHAFCLALTDAGLRLPPALLPQALDAGRRSAALRPSLSPVLGERGGWLAAQHETWRYAAGAAGGTDEPATWTDGSIDQRRAFLAAERRRDPAASRERLAAALPELAAKERADLAGVLAGSLSADDEPLLDQLRADRSREVRQVALGLLLRLPAAAHPARAMARLEALVRRERVLPVPRWTLDAPEAVDPGWKDDQVDAVRPAHDSLGERGWWLYQLVRQVPLSWWTAHTGQTAAQLRAWADSTDWAEALLRGWRDVLGATAAPDWCEAFLADWPAKLWRDGSGAVLALLPVAAREAHWLRRVAHSPAALDDVVSESLATCPPGETLSPALSAPFASQVRQRIDAGALAHDYRLRGMLPDLCSALHPDTLGPFVDLPRSADETPGQSESLDTVAQVVAVRRALLTLRPPRTP